MSQFDRVLWEEGMFLGPQHFQQWDRQSAHAFATRTRAVRALDWGATIIDVDQEALLGGQLALRRVAGVFGDGTAFSAPEVDSVPAPRPLKDAFPPSVTEARVYIALPRRRAGAMVAREDDPARTVTRYTRGLVTVIDEVGGAVERDIATARQNLRLLLEGEPRDDFESLPIAVVQRTPTGSFALAKGFIPTCLYASASTALMSILRRVFELLQAKRDELSAKRGQRLGGQAQYGAGGEMNILLLHTLSTHLPAIAHLYQQAQVHPSDIYRELACLAGGLSTFHASDRKTVIPPYHHDEPTEAFAALLHEVEELPGNLAPDRAVAIPMTLSERDVHQGRVVDESLFEQAEFYLAVRSEVGADRLIKEFPFKAKVSAPEQLGQIRTVAVMGVRMTHVQSAPSEIPQRAGAQYFRLQLEGKHWEAIKLARILALFVPADFTELALECYAVRRK